MPPKATLGLATVLSSALLLVAAVPAAASAVHQPRGHAAHASRHELYAGRYPKSSHELYPGRYPNVFARTGYRERAINSKVNAAWQQLFHGSPGTQPNRGDGQTIYYQLSPTMAYVEDIGNHDVRTEGMGYAMMLSVQLNHKAEFDALWNFAKSKMQLQSGPEQYYFAWHTDTTGKVLSTGVAPDGDQWIAAALVFASHRWGNGSGIYDYGQQAELILHAMWHASDNGGVDMFNPQTDLPIFSPPATFLNYTDPSYSLPAFYRVFAVADPSDTTQWDKADAAGEQLLQRAYNPSTGLAPDYANFDGTPYTTRFDTADSYDHTFQEDAWRAIANANIDAAWWGVKPWQTNYSNTLENFFEGRGVDTYVSRYHLDGTPVAQGQNTYEPAHAQGLVAMNATSAISATNPEKSAFVRDLWNTPVPSGQARYYDGMLYILGLVYDSGKFRIWSPMHNRGHAGAIR